MSLNGLDAEKVTAAHDAAVTEAAGWFLLHYISRDEVDLLGSGDNGFAEAREAIAKYEESSPLFGLVVYKKKKALLKYVPEDTSRLLQARLSVHVQSVIEKFPHDALISFTVAGELTESALSSALTQLKSSGSIRSNESKKHRHLTEIPEDSDELAPKSAPSQEEPGDTTEAVIGPESPPDPLLSPATEPFSPARLEEKSIPFNTPEVEKGSFAASSPLSLPDISSDKEYSEPSSSPQASSKTPGLLVRSSTYELDDSWTYKPKVKLGPRPSLDYEKKRSYRGSAYRPVAALPAGLKISTRSKEESERPSTARSTSWSTLDEMRRVAAFSVPVEPPTSRPGSVRSGPSRASSTDRETPISSATPTITPEKLRLMKALEKRKKYQQSKQEAATKEEPPSEAVGSTTVNGNSEEIKSESNGTTSEEAAASAEAVIAQEVPAPDHSLDLSTLNTDEIIEPEPSADSTVPIDEAHSPPLHLSAVRTDEATKLDPPAGSTFPTDRVPSAPSAITSNDGEGLQGETAKHTPNTVHPIELEDDTSKEAVEVSQVESIAKPAAPLVATDEDAWQTTDANRESIQDGVYLARSESSSGSEAGADDARPVPLEGANSESGSISHLPIQVTEITDDLPAELYGIRSDRGVVEAIDNKRKHVTTVELLTNDAAKVEAPTSTAAPEPRPGAGFDFEDSTINDDEEVGATFLHLESEQATPAVGLENATGFFESKELDTTAGAPTVRTHGFPSVGPASKDARDSIATLKALESHHRHTDSASTVKPPPLPEGPTQTIISNVRITTDDGTSLMKPPTTLSTEPKQPSARISAENKRLSAATADTKRSSADSKASKRRPAPLSPSKHDSSDIASLDGDLLYEELQSAKLEEATSMIVARSPATPFFQDPPRSAARDADLNTARSPVTPGTSDFPDALRAKLVHTSSPPVLSRFSSDQSTSTLRPGPVSVAETLDSPKLRTFALTANSASQSPQTTGNGNSSPPRKSSGVSSLISQRIKAIEGARANGSASPTDRTSMISPQIVSQRKASLTTPPGSAGAGSPGANRAFQHSPSSNDFVARTFGSVRVSSSHAHRGTNGTLERQPSRESSTGLNQSASSSRLSSLNSSPNEKQKVKASYFSVEPIEKGKKSQSFSSPTSNPGSPGHGGRLSISSKKSNTSQKSGNTERQISPGRSESSMSSEGDGEKKRNSRGSRILQRISGMGSPRRNIAEALSEEPTGEAAERRGSNTKRPSTSKQPPAANGTKWIARDLGDVNVQFPDNLLWKRRHMEVDVSGNVVLAPASTDTKSKVQSKRYHISQFTSPYIPDQDREELPHSIILDLQGSSTLQCSCENGREQTMVLQVLRAAHATFVAK